MRRPRFYYPETLAVGQQLMLPAEITHHLARVLRAQVGDEFVLFNGAPGDFLAHIISFKKKQITAEISAFIPRVSESALRLHLAQALPKSSKMDFILQKAVELGVQEITPLQTDFVNVHLDATRAHQRHLHWQNILANASAQCGRTCVPILHPLTTLQDFIENSAVGGVMLAPEASVKLSDLELNAELPVILLIGPEGGFSPAELGKTQAAAFSCASLGPRILRTETASVAALSILQARFGDI